MNFERGTAEQVAQWREDIANARANLAIEGLPLTGDEDAMFAMMLDEGVPPAIMPSIILDLYKAWNLPDRGRMCLETPAASG